MSAGFTRRSLLASVAALGVGINVPARASSFVDFEMPFESDRHTRTFMQWPVSVDVYGEELLEQVQRSIAEVAQAIATYEEVVVLVSDKHAAKAKSLLGGSVKTWNIPTNDLWCRDSGPTFIRDETGALGVVQIQFNGWGRKQVNNHDKHIARRVAERLELPFIRTKLVGEQGGLEHDGAGLVMAHASSWVNPNRNRGTAAKVGRQILDAVGGEKMIWGPGIKGADITDYHIDALARFVAPGKVLIQLPKEIDPEDPWSKSAFETYEILKGQTTLEGKPLDIVVVNEPTNIRSRNREFVSSYVNYYVCNDAVISSNFGDTKADGQAREILEELYPNRKIISLNTDPIGESGGGIHCATQQQPA